jgi:hypothetical protein
MRQLPQVRKEQAQVGFKLREGHLLSSIVTFGDRRTEAFGPLPKWRKTVSQRPSLRDLSALTRREAEDYLDRPAATQSAAA